MEVDQAKVLAVMRERFPREYEICVLSVALAESTAAVEQLRDGDGDAERAGG